MFDQTGSFKSLLAVIEHDKSLAAILAGEAEGSGVRKGRRENRDFGLSHRSGPRQGNRSRATEEDCTGSGRGEDQAGDAGAIGDRNQHAEERESRGCENAASAWPPGGRSPRRTRKIRATHSTLKPGDARLEPESGKCTC